MHLVPMIEVVKNTAIELGFHPWSNLAMQGDAFSVVIDVPAGSALLMILAGAALMAVGRRRNLRWLRITGLCMLSAGVLVIGIMLLIIFV